MFSWIQEIVLTIVVSGSLLGIMYYLSELVDDRFVHTPVYRTDWVTKVLVITVFVYGSCIVYFLIFIWPMLLGFMRTIE